jgi:hypothetical protein
MMNRTNALLVGKVNDLAARLAWKRQEADHQLRSSTKKIITAPAPAPAPAPADQHQQ